MARALRSFPAARQGVERGEGCTKQKGAHETRFRSPLRYIRNGPIYISFPLFPRRRDIAAAKFSDSKTLLAE